MVHLDQACQGKTCAYCRQALQSDPAFDETSGITVPVRRGKKALQRAHELPPARLGVWDSALGGVYAKKRSAVMALSDRRAPHRASARYSSPASWPCSTPHRPTVCRGATYVWHTLTGTMVVESSQLICALIDAGLGDRSRQRRAVVDFQQELAQPDRTCGRVKARGQLLTPVGFTNQEPHRQQRQGHVVTASRAVCAPDTHPCDFALASLKRASIQAPASTPRASSASDGSLNASLGPPSA